MDYIFFPSKDLDGLETLIEELHLSPRVSIDGKEVVMKCTNYKKLFPEKVILIDTLDEEGNGGIQTVFPYDTYDSKETNTILTGNNWSDDSALTSSPVEDAAVDAQQK